MTEQIFTFEQGQRARAVAEARAALSGFGEGRPEPWAIVYLAEYIIGGSSNDDMEGEEA